MWVNSLEQLHDVNLVKNDRCLLEQVAPQGKEKQPHLDELVKDQSYTNEQLQRIFLVSGQGGMRKSNRLNSLVLISKHDSGNPYDDTWNGDHFEYTGMGMNGDQSVDYMQNKTLAESNTNGVTVYLFESFENNNYIYKGIVKLDGVPYYEIQEDDSGNKRRVVKFSLKIIG